MRFKTVYKSFSNHFMVIIFSILLSCNKNGAGCFDKAGNIKTVTIDLPAFTTIDVATNVDVEILGKGSDLIELIAGENLVAGISFKVADDILKIENLNTCFFARGYTSPLIKIRSLNLSRIVQHGYGRIFSKDTLKFDQLTIQVEDASGEVDLIIDAKKIDVVTNNIGPIILNGKTESLNVGQYWSDGIFYGKDLQAQNCQVNHNGSNRININVINNLTGSVNSIGNVYLYGQKPASINVELTNSGEIFEEF